MMFDYRFRFDNVGRALDALAALRAAGVLPADQMSGNMLGAPMDEDGDPCARDDAAFFGAFGPDDMWHIAIRSDVGPNAIPFDPVTYGLIAETAEESAAVLGVWAGTIMLPDLPEWEPPA